MAAIRGQLEHAERRAERAERAVAEAAAGSNANPLYTAAHPLDVESNPAVLKGRLQVSSFACALSVGSSVCAHRQMLRCSPLPPLLVNKGSGSLLWRSTETNSEEGAPPSFEALLVATWGLPPLHTAESQQRLPMLPESLPPEEVARHVAVGWMYPCEQSHE